MLSGIYLITCTASGNRYVGSSKNIESRWKEHRKRLGLKTHKGRKVSPETIELMRQRRREWWARKRSEQID